MNKKIVFDTCVIRDLDKRFSLPEEVTIMDFQKDEVPNQILKNNRSRIRIVPKLRNQCLKKRDENFLLLSNKDYSLFTYDKKLKKKLYKNKYNVINNFKEYQDIIL